MRDKDWRQEPGGRDDTCDHGLSKSWKVDINMKKTEKKTVRRGLDYVDFFRLRAPSTDCGYVASTWYTCYMFLAEA